MLASESHSVPPVPKIDVAAAASSSLSKTEPNKDMVDFFSSIESEQQKMFNSPTGRYEFHSRKCRLSLRHPSSIVDNRCRFQTNRVTIPSYNNL